ncbi:MAG: substrate-binding domain-containing protein [Planctomycetes bacterium]|nr:substrate-binding domain-containing protein [Planctomycetota bacterium]
MGEQRVVRVVLADVLRRLANGSWPEGTSVPSSRELAEELGVSQPTLLAALRRAARRHLLSIAPRQAAVVPAGATDRARRMLARLASRTDGRRAVVLVPEAAHYMNNPFHRTLLEAITREAVDRRIRIIVERLPLRGQVPAVRSLINRGINAAACLALDAEYTAAILTMHEREFPVMLVNRRFPGADMPTVRIDDHLAAEGIADRLIDLGHRSLCMVSHFSPDRTQIGDHFIDRWLTHLESRGVLPGCRRPLMILPWCDELRRHEHTFDPLLEGPDRPTAVVFTAALWAEVFVADPRAKALNIPDDLSLAVLNPGGAGLCGSGGVALTTIEINYRRMAECVVEMLGHLLEGNVNPPSLRVPLDIHLTESIGPAPVASRVSLQDPRGGDRLACPGSD